MVGEWRKDLRDFKGSLLFGSWFPRGIVEMEICHFQPHLISNVPRGEALSISFLRDPTSSFMCNYGFFLSVL